MCSSDHDPTKIRADIFFPFGDEHFPNWSIIPAVGYLYDGYIEVEIEPTKVEHVERVLSNDKKQCQIDVWSVGNFESLKFSRVDGFFDECDEGRCKIAITVKS